MGDRHIKGTYHSHGNGYLYEWAYEEWTLQPEYRDFMGFINISGQFDAENNMPGAERPVNTRSARTEIVGINGLHPLYEGYMQVADAVYRNMVHLCKDNM